jgi:hypothetical protein
MSDGHIDPQSVEQGVKSASLIISTMVEDALDLELREAMAPELWASIRDEMRNGEFAGTDPETWWLICEGATCAIEEWVKTGVTPALPTSEGQLE